MRIVRRLFREDCLLCSDAAGRISNLCDACLSDLLLLGHSCPICSRSMPVRTLCNDCSARMPAFQSTLAPYQYAGAVKYLIGRAKFDSNLAATLSLGELLAGWLKLNLLSRPDVLIPVPLHPSRLRHRGYNQATEVAKVVSKQLGIAVRGNFCERVRDTQPQSEMVDGRARRRNVRGAFSCRNSAGELGSVALVDDVMTTGATLRELAVQLVKAGVSDIQVWVVSRTVSFYNQ